MVMLSQNTPATLERGCTETFIRALKCCFQNASVLCIAYYKTAANVGVWVGTGWESFPSLSPGASLTLFRICEYLKI